MIVRLVIAWLFELLSVFWIALIFPDSYDYALIPVSICIVSASHFVFPIITLFSDSYENFAHVPSHIQIDNCQSLNVCLHLIIECVIGGIFVAIVVKNYV